jgi:hypothetical protein
MFAPRAPEGTEDYYHEVKAANTKSDGKMPHGAP